MRNEHRTGRWTGPFRRRAGDPAGRAEPPGPGGVPAAVPGLERSAAAALAVALGLVAGPNPAAGLLAEPPPVAAPHAVPNPAAGGGLPAPDTLPPEGEASGRTPSCFAEPASSVARGKAAGGGEGRVGATESGPSARDGGSRAAGGRVYLSREEAFLEIFGEARRVVGDCWRLPPTLVRRIEEGSRVEVPHPVAETFRVYGEKDRLLGYAMVLEERGKYRPITFMVGLDPEMRVTGVEVMVYREDRGDEVRYGRFLRQYRGKRRSADLRTHRDIVNITGATISVHSMNDGVRRALWTLSLLYGAGGGGDPVASHRELESLRIGAGR